jgi:hypothetical protein
VTSDKLLRLSNPEWRDHGEVVAFRVEREDGAMLDVSCPLPELGDIFTFLATLAKAAAEARDMESPADQPYFSVIPCDGLGFAAGRTSDETLLVVSLSGFGLSFAIPNNVLAALGPGLARTAATLSAAGERRN